MADGDSSQSIIHDLHQSFAEFKRDNAASALVLVAAHRCFDGGFVEEMAELFLNPDNEEVLRFVGWDLIGLLVKSHDQHSIHLLDAISEVCSPKEVCLGIVEQMDTNLSTHCFLMLLSPLKKAYCKLKARRSKFLKMILPKLSRYIMELKESDDDISNEDSTPSRLGLYDVLEKVIGLIDLIAQDNTGLDTQNKADHFDEPENTSQSLELVKCLISLLEILVTENLSSKIIDASCSRKSYRYHAVFIAKLLCKLHYSVVAIIELTMEYTRSSNRRNSSQRADSNLDENNEEEESSHNEDSEDFPPLGLACFSYLSFVEGACYVPQVFSLDYLFRINLVGIACLLQRSNEEINEKGVELLSSLTEKIEKGSLGHHYIRQEGFLDIPKALINIMIYSTSKPLRIKATHLLQNLIAKLETHGRYILLRYLLLDCKHAGVAALLVQAIKDEVHSNLNSQHGNTWFKGKQLISLLHQVCKLPQGVGAEVDIVPDTERMMAILNCLRYILLRDREDEVTLWKNFVIFEKGFLEPLRESLKLTRIRYTAVQKQSEDQAKEKGKTQEEDESKMDFTVTTPDGTPISAMSIEDQTQVVQSGLYALDMMDCIIAHIAEIVAARS